MRSEPSPGIELCLEGFAALAGRRGKPERAAQLLRAAAAPRASIDDRTDPADSIQRDHALTAVRAALGEAAFAAAWADGRSMAMEQAIAHADRPRSRTTEVQIFARTVANRPPA